MARENVTVSIKGDIKDLETKINQSKVIINDAVKSISTENKKLSETQQDLINVQGKYSDEIKKSKTEINKYLEIKKENGKLTKEESTDLAKLKAGLTLLNNKTKELVDTERKKIAQTRANVSANKNLIDSQKISMEVTENELKSKKKVLEWEEKYQQSLRESNRAINEKISAQEKEGQALRQEVLLYEPLESKINTYTSKTNKLDQALKKKIITTNEYKNSLKILNQELAKTTGVDKFGYSNRAISSSAISKGVSLQDSNNAEQKATEDSIKAQEKYVAQLEKNKQKEKEYAKAKYETVTSLLAQKRAEEQLERDLKINAKNEKSRLKEEYVRKYQNTHAQNAYNDALKHLNVLKKSGVITSGQYNSALKKEKISLSEATISAQQKTKATSNLTNETIRYLRWAGTIAGVVYAGKRAWDATIGTGIEVNKIIESNTYGIAALVSANTRMVDSLGNTLSPVEKFTMGQEQASKVIAQLRKESIKTAATFPQLLAIFQQGIGKTLSLGSAFGQTTEEIEKNTVTLSARMSVFADAIGMEMGKVNEEMRSMVSGTVSTDSLISTILFGSPTEANAQIKEASSKVNGLTELLDKKFAAFEILFDTKTFNKSVLAMQDSWSRAMGDMVKKSGAFQDITDMFYSIAEDINENQNNIIVGFDKAYLSAKQFMSILSELGGVADELSIPLGNLSDKLAEIYDDNFANTFMENFKIMISDVGAGAKLAINLVSVLITATTNNLKNFLLDFKLNWKETILSFKSGLDSFSNTSIFKDDRLKLEKEIIEVRKQIIDNELATEKAKLDLFEKSDKIHTRLIASRHEILNSDKKLVTVMTEQESKKAGLNKLLKNEAKLIANISRNKKLFDQAEKASEKSKSRILKYEEANAKFSLEILNIKSKIAAENKRGKVDTRAISQLEKDKAVYTKAVLDNTQKIAEENKKASDKAERKATIALKKSIEQNKQDTKHKAILKEIELIESENIDSESRKLALSELKLNSLAEQFSLLSESKDQDKVRLEILKEGLRYEELLTKEAEKQNKAKQFSSISKNVRASDAENLNQIYQELKINYTGDEQSLDDLEKWYDKTFKKFTEKPLTIDIKLEGFDEVSNSIATIGNSFQDMTKASEEYNKVQKNATANEVEKKQASMDYASATISGYGNMSNAVAGFYSDDDDRKRKQFEVEKAIQAAKMAMKVAEMSQSTAFTGLFVAQEATKATAAGATAVATAAASSPWTGFATATAMAAMLASFGVILTSSGTDTDVSYDNVSAQKENKGRGSVFGDLEAGSESIKNSLSILEDFAKPQYSTLSQMNKYLASIDSKMGGVANLLIRQGGFQFGEGFEGYSNSKQNFKLNDKLAIGALAGGAGILLNELKIPLLSDITGLLGNTLNSVLGGLFGKTSRESSLSDAGILFADQLLTQALEDFEGQAYQTIKTTVTKKSWFKKSSSTSYQTFFSELNDETERQFQLVVDSIYNTVLESGKALDVSSAEIEKSLEDFVLSIGKISLKGKSGDEIQEQISNIFGKVSDEITEEAFPLLVGFQKVGEGLFETLTRVATGMEEADYYASRLGNIFSDISYTSISNQQGDVGFEALLQTIVQMEEATNGASNNLVKIIENLNGTTEELYVAYDALDGLRSRIRFLSQDTEGLSSSMIRGAGSVGALSSGFESYFENFLTEGEQLGFRASELQKEFAKLNIEMPTTKEGFSDLLKGIDLTTESGQELYGRLIILSEQFAEVSDEAESAISKLKEALKDQLAGFEDVVNGVQKISDSFISAISNISTSIENLRGGVKGADNLQIKEEQYWTKRTELESLLSKGSGVNTSESERINTLVSELAGLAPSIQEGYEDNTNITSNLTSDLINIQDRLEGSSKSLEQVIAEGMDKLATEKTLSSLTEYSKLMLKVQQQEIEGETESLSAKTFTYGDYIGKQEKINIAEKLGTSYESAEPLVEKLKALNVSQNLDEDIAKLLGYDGGISYDTGKASQIMNLSDYLSEDIISSVSGIVQSSEAAKEEVKAEQERKRIEQEKSQLNELIAVANSKYLVEKKQAETVRDILGSDQGIVEYENYSLGSRARFGGGERDYNDTDTERFNSYKKEFSEALFSYEKYKKLLEEKKLKGYANGGYTGKGGKYEIAGYLHKNEHVIKSEEVDAIGGEYAIKQMVANEIMSKKTKKAINSSSYDNSNKTNGIIEELKKGQEILTSGINILADQLNEIVDFNEERRSEGYITKVTGEVKAIAG